jgi:serpin B
MPDIAEKMKIPKPFVLCCLIGGMILLNACNVTLVGEPTPSPASLEIPYGDLVLEELDQTALADPGIPGCRLADLRPFGWKEVDSGLVDIRTPEDYAIRTESLYQEGFLDYLQARLEYPETYQSIPEMTYEAFLATCAVFPDVDFSQYSVLGYQATGTGCTATFEKHVYRDDQNKQILYELTIVEEGTCETAVHNRNLILVPRIPTDYSVDFSKRISRETTAEITPATLDELVAGNNHFAYDLFHAVAQEEGNLFFSPYSISTALAMTYAGAQGETSTQMADTLHYTLPQSQLHPAFNALNQYLMASDDKEEFAVAIANALWSQEDEKFRQEYLDLLDTHYSAEMHLVNFQSENGRMAASERINQWVSDATGERITDLVNPKLFTSLTRLVLTNAITFDSSWQHPFDGDTKNASFTLLDGSRVRVPLMQRYATITPHAIGEGWQAAEVAYQGGCAHMLILLPSEGQFERFAAELDAARLAEIEAALTPTDLLLYLPRFEYAADLTLSETLADMGMPLAFSATEADFSGMAEMSPPLYLANVLHKAYIAVDELGTEAVAATEVEVAVGSEEVMPETMRVDQPFLFLIRDTEQGMILFLGSLVNPAAS